MSESLKFFESPSRKPRETENKFIEATVDDLLTNPEVTRILSTQELDELRESAVLEKNHNVEQIIKAIAEVITSGESIGVGRSADVRVLTPDSKRCIKIIHTKSEAVNNATVEMELQSKAHSLGVRVPVPVCSITTEKGNDYIVMETIEGLSIAEYIDRDISFPDKFDPNKFRASLASQLELMHRGQLHHRDLHGGNVMISSLGEVVIIDFGHAKEVVFDSDDPYFDPPVVPGSNEETYPRDLDNLRLLNQKVIVHSKKGNITYEH